MLRQGRSGRRTFAKWTLSIVAVASLCAWLASGVWYVMRTWTTPPGITSFMIVRGEVFAARQRRSPEHELPWYVGENPMGLFRQFHWWFVWKNDAGTTAFAIPLWAPALMAGLPAVLMWRSEVRQRQHRRRGCCVSCGYDRNGLDGAVPCPECGAAPALK